MRLALILCVLLLPAIAVADEVHDLSRICAGESGLDVTDDCAAIHAVLTYRAEVIGTTWQRAARAYSPGHLGLRKRPRRPWIAGLRLDGRQPRGWPRKLRWSRHRARWLALVEHARAIVRGDVEAPCEPAHWGDRHGDRERALAMGWTEIDCGDTRNLYWRVPRRGEAS